VATVVTVCASKALSATVILPVVGVLRRRPPRHLANFRTSWCPHFSDQTAAGASFEQPAFVVAH
jgi:hypothetical protein